MFEIDENDVLVVVDVQKDFCTGGALPVPEGDQVVPVLNEYMLLFGRKRARIYATRDWHPPNHVSFKAYGGVWPSHCVQGSVGAEFHPDLMFPEDVKIVSKATESSREAYSGFDGTRLDEELRKKG